MGGNEPCCTDENYLAVEGCPYACPKGKAYNSDQKTCEDCASGEIVNYTCGCKEEDKCPKEGEIWNDVLVKCSCDNANDYYYQALDDKCVYEPP